MAHTDAGMPDLQTMQMLKHDIKNQLSNITLAVEGLRYEVNDLDSDVGLYLESVLSSAQKIDQLLNIISAEK